MPRHDRGTAEHWPKLDRLDYSRINAATALAAIIAGCIAWRSLRRDIDSQVPIVEAEFRWMEPAQGDYLGLTLVIRNQLYERLVLEVAHAKKPRHTLISKDRQRGKDGGLAGVVKGTLSTVEINREIAPIGTATALFSPGMLQRMDVSRVELFLSPPDNWDGGRLIIHLRIASKSLATRPRRVVINKKIDPRPVRALARQDA
jgi:hypothetical protein